MGEQRPMFRFRLPWMISSAPAPPPVAAQRPQQAPLTPSQPQTKSEPTVNPTMPARRPFRLPGMAPAQPPPPIQPPVESQSEPITITSTPRVLPQASPTRSPKVSAAQDPHSQAEIPPEIKSQTENSFQPAPPSPSRTHSPPTQLPSSPPSPQLSATSHPPSPLHIPSQEQDTSQLPSPKSDPRPSSPRPTSSKASDASQTSSPSQTTSKVRDASQPSSPDRTHFQKSSQAETFQQPHSPPQFQSSGQKSPVTSSPSLTATNVQQTTPQSPPRAETPLSTFQPQTNIEPNVNPTTPVQRPASVIALVGKNKGAVMKLGSEPANGEGSFKTHRANKTEPVEGTKENERNESAKRRSSNNKLDQENRVKKTYVNNNVQDINNSLLMNSSITERNPGVHLALYYDPTEPIMSYDRKGSSEARKGKSRLPLPKAYT